MARLRAGKQIYASHVAQNALEHIELSGAAAKYTYNPVLGHYVLSPLNVTLKIDSSH